MLSKVGLRAKTPEINALSNKRYKYSPSLLIEEPRPCTGVQLSRNFNLTSDKFRGIKPLNLSHQLSESVKEDFSPNPKIKVEI